MAFTPPTLASETIAHIGSFPIRNSMLMGWMAIAVLIIAALIFKKKGGKIVPTGFQNLIESIVEMLFNFFDSVTNDREQTKQFFPIVATIFLFVLTSNWMGILPGVGSIGFYEDEHTAIEAPITSQETTLEKIAEPKTPQEQASIQPNGTEPVVAEKKEPVLVPYFRSGFADVNMTLALAIISVVVTQFFGIWSLGFFGYAGKFFVNPFKDPIGFFVGILELVSEFAKMVSFAFRLFGNIFAGEILLMVISFLVPYIVPLPFYGLEIFVGFVQALVFSLLTLVFLKMAVTSHHAEAHA